LENEKGKCMRGVGMIEEVEACCKDEFVVVLACSLPQKMALEIHRVQKSIGSG
jgi:hypothetical protein